MSIVRLNNIYIILEHLEKRPAMYLGPEPGISKLELLHLGYSMARGKENTPSLEYPSFRYFGEWLAGVLRTVSTNSWGWILLQKYKYEQVAFQKFFVHLHKYKAAEIDLNVVSIPKRNVERVLSTKDRFSKMQLQAIKRLSKIILFRLSGSPTVFCVLVDERDTIVYEERETSGKYLVESIEELYGVTVKSCSKAKLKDGMRILEKNKIISADHKYSALVFNE